MPECDISIWYIVYDVIFIEYNKPNKINRNTLVKLFNAFCTSINASNVKATLSKQILILGKTFYILHSYLFGQYENDVIGEPVHVLIPSNFTLQYFKSQQIKENAKEY